jgi:calmodulin
MFARTLLRQLAAPQQLLAPFRTCLIALGSVGALRTSVTDTGREARKSVTHKKEIFEAFLALDHDKDGFITKHDLRRALNKTELANKLSEEELRQLIAEADIDGDGRINIQEFEIVSNAHPEVMHGHMPAEAKKPYDRGFG